MRPFPLLSVIAALIFAGLLLGSAAWLRGPEYDEGYTAFVTGKAPRPAWPTAPFRAGDMRGAFTPAPMPWRIAGNLRRTDVHPPLYFWAIWVWRRVFGPDLWVSRLLSVAFSLGALAVLAALAREAGFPVVPALLITIGAYGFVATGITMRGFALAQCLMLAGLLLVLRCARKEPGQPLAAGLLLGAASFSNYLTAFTATAALLWLAMRNPRRAVWLLIGLLPFIAGDGFFFLAQRGSRIGQFPPFTIGGMAAALAHAAGGALLGGLPLYLPTGVGRVALTGLLGALLIAMLGLPAVLWRRMTLKAPAALFAMAAIAPVLGLCVMGLVAGTIPVEIRYLCFAIPPFALMLAEAAVRLSRPIGLSLLAVLLTVQGSSIAGLLTRPETMQPEQAAARAAWAQAGSTGLALLPRGNDGVGIVSAFLTAAPDDLHILLVTPQTTEAELAGVLTRGQWPCVTTAMIGADRDSRATLSLLARMRNLNCQMR
ncbi:glycosyltransferase family 39 protein [Acidisoma cellulosilytica]|uniref:Glycosyltransferase family 39 protein n=1 Tax=Acidisoma cellulosilyticum TaxID=2802395 RepID=A0A963YZM8_9PROT|nr:glycosyltransferase family 39 protein [Acidisoma cellulosilyticum]MCB8879128.1 glycosyltransferase family 39 protein [Acidisoma cellulosilyticum]